MGETTTYIRKFSAYPQLFSNDYHSPSVGRGNYYSPLNNYQSSNGTPYMNGNFNHNLISDGRTSGAIMRSPVDSIMPQLLNSEFRVSRLGTGTNAYSYLPAEWNKTKEVDMTNWKTSTANDSFCRRNSPLREKQSPVADRQAGLFHHDSPTRAMHRGAPDLSLKSVDNSRSPDQSPYKTKSILTYPSYLSPSLRLSLSRTRFSDVTSPPSLSSIGLNETRPRYKARTDQKCVPMSSPSRSHPSVDSFRNIHSRSPYPNRSPSALPAKEPWRYNVGDFNRSNYKSWSPNFSAKASPTSRSVISQFESDDRHRAAVSKSISLDLYYEMRSKYLNCSNHALYNVNSGNIYGQNSERNGGPAPKISSGMCFDRRMNSFFTSEMSRLHRINKTIKESTNSQHVFNIPKFF